jgi:hypothetical protein
MVGISSNSYGTLVGFFSGHSLEAVCLPSGRADLAAIRPWQSYMLTELLEVGKERAVRWKLVGQDEGIQNRSTQ